MSQFSPILFLLLVLLRLSPALWLVPLSPARPPSRLSAHTYAFLKTTRSLWPVCNKWTFVPFRFSWPPAVVPFAPNLGLGLE